jgi:nucleoside-diphosphate-sugar epimerase
MNESIVAVSGASGWLGLETIERLSSNLSDSHLLLYSSNGRSLVGPNNATILTKDFLSADPPETLEGFIHLAFLTREKVSSVGYSEYVSKNVSLISKACKVIETSKPKWIVLVSSGAIFDRNTGNLETDCLKNPYGFCKRIEENLILDSANKVGANVVIGRLWGATGGLMPLNSEYAISDFIQSAHQHKQITIRSAGSVFRRYVDAGDFMQVLYEAAVRGETITINSGGPKTEIGALATLVSDHFDDIEIVRPVQDDLSDDYFPRDHEFEALAKRFDVKLSDIELQVTRTVKGHVSALLNQDLRKR